MSGNSGSGSTRAMPRSVGQPGPAADRVPYPGVVNLSAGAVRGRALSPLSALSVLLAGSAVVLTILSLLVPERTVVCLASSGRCEYSVRRGIVNLQRNAPFEEALPAHARLRQTGQGEGDHTYDLSFGSLVTFTNAGYDAPIMANNANALVEGTAGNGRFRYAHGPGRAYRWAALTTWFAVIVLAVVRARRRSAL